jgi:hypothetical protein
MSSTTALVPYSFEGHRIRVSTDEHGEAWFAAADVAGALGQQPIARGLTSLREEEHCLYSQEGPGSEGCTLALISEGGLLRLLLLGDNPTTWRMRRWLTHELLPALPPGVELDGVRLVNPYFEAVPLTLFAGVAVEAGLLAPDEVAAAAREGRAAVAAAFGLSEWA